MHNIFNPHHPYNFRYRRVDLTLKINASDAIYSFIKERLGIEEILPEEVSLQGYRIRTEDEAEWVKSQLNNPSSRYASLYNIQSERQSWQRFDYIPSNLGNGYVFYFVCNECSRLVRNLYMPDGQSLYLCRSCHRLSYPPSNRRTKPPLITQS